MAVNGIEIEVGQKWRTRSGGVVEISEHDQLDPIYPWGTGDGDWYMDTGAYSQHGEYPKHDLIELLEHADGFKPWTGGEQPEETRGKRVTVRHRDGDEFTEIAGTYRSAAWRHFGHCADIIAYKVIEEATPAEPLRVELIEPAVSAPADALDIQVGGDHYKSLAIQPVAYIHANGIGYFEGNVIKYVTRWRAKNGIKDLEKAKHYIDLLIELEGGAK